MKRKHSIIITSGVLALLAFFTLVAFARTILDGAIDKTREGYEQQIADLQVDGLDRQNTSDPFVTRADAPPPVFDSDPIKGPEQAALTIIEYGDFQCPFCADIAPVLDRALEANDNVRLVWKDLPNPIHFNARQAANAARCAQEQDSFWPYHDTLFLNQENLSDELYLQAAESLELDQAAFARCLAAQTYDPLVSQGLDDANAYNIDATPYLFVGETRVDRLIEFDELMKIVNQEIVN